MLTKEGKRMSNKTGEVLKGLRKERNLSLQDVADEIGCSASYLHRLENSTRKNPSMKMVQNLAEFYQVNLSEILAIDQGEMVEVIAAVELKETIETEINTAIENMKEGLALLNENNKHFVEVQKSLLYIQSLI